jgi:hypothetical protein
MAPKVRDAAIATTMVLGHQNRAVKLLEEHAAINALGVLTYPAHTARPCLKPQPRSPQRRNPTASDYAKE